jgi:hypothetical protein
MWDLWPSLAQMDQRMANLAADRWEFVAVIETPSSVQPPRPDAPHWAIFKRAEEIALYEQHYGDELTLQFIATIRGLEAEKEALRAKLVECRDVIHKRAEFPHEFCEEIDRLTRCSPMSDLVPGETGDPEPPVETPNDPPAPGLRGMMTQSELQTKC